MNKIERENPYQDAIETRRVFWAAIIYTIVAFSSVGLAVFLILRYPVWQVYVMTVIAVISLVCDLISIVLLRRQQASLALKILYWSSLIIVPLNIFLFAGFSILLILMVLIIGYVNVFYLFPKSWRKKYQYGPFIAAIVMLVVDLINPVFRINLGNASGNFGYITLIFLVLGLALIAIRLAWSGNIRVKLVTSFTVVAFISVGIVGTVAYVSYQNQLREDIRQRLVNMVNIAALQQDGDLHAAVQNPGDEETNAYQQIQAKNLAIVATDPTIAYLYTMRMDDQGQIRFYVDAGQPGDDDLAVVAEVYEEPTDLMISQFPTLDYAFAEEEFFTDKWGTWLSAYAPFYNAAGEREGIIGIDIAADTVIALERNVLLLISVATIGALVAVTVIGVFLANIFTGPIVNLAITAQKVTEGNLSTRAEVETSDEIGDLAIAFNEMTAQLQNTLEGLEQQVANRTRALETSTEVGRQLSTILDQDQLVREVVQRVRDAFDYYHAQIYLYDAQKENLVMAGGTGAAGRTLLEQEHSVPKGRGLVGRAADTNLPILVEDVSKSIGWLPNPLLPETKAEAALPIAVGQSVLGVLDVQDDEVGGLTEIDVDLLQSIANQVASALQNAQAYHRTQEQVDREALMASINHQIQSTTDVENALKVAVRELGRALGSNTRIQLNTPAEKSVGSD